MSFLEEFQKQQKALKDSERRNKLTANETMHQYHGGDQDRLRDHERAIHNERKKSSHPQHYGQGHDAHLIPVNAGGDEEDILDCPRSGRSRQLVEVDFTFGILCYEEEESDEILLPDPVEAAEIIIPSIIREFSKETKIVCDPKLQSMIVNDDLDIDDWYNGDGDKDGGGSIRYIIKGTVPVTLFVVNVHTESEDEEDDQDDEKVSTITQQQKALQKFLKRRVSFRPVSTEELQTSSKEKKQEFIRRKNNNNVGEGEYWVRVRDGRLAGLGITF